MKDMFLTLVAALVTINLLYSVNELKTVTNELKRIEMIEMMQNPEHSEDVIVEAVEYSFSDEELTEILGL